jgi:hypothetical protein
MIDLETFGEQVREAHEAEVRDARPVTSLDELPLDYDHLTCEWLTALVGGTVTGFRTEDADDLGRGHARIWLEGDGIPESVFCKDSHRVELRVFNAFLVEGEVDFYNGIAAELGVELPECLYARYDRQTSNSLLVFRDLREHGLEFCTEQTHVTRALAEGQVRHLARVHARFATEMDTHPLLVSLRPFSQVFERVNTIFAGAFDAAVLRGFDACEPVVPPAVTARRAEVWPAVQAAVEIQRRTPPTLTHNDCHIDNWYPTPAGELRMGDWQIVARGDLAFDLALVLSTSLTVEDRRAWERELIALYAEQLAAHGLGVEDLWTRYRQQLFMVLAWWTPTVKSAVGFDFHDATGTLEIVRRITTAIDDIDAWAVIEHAGWR